MYFKAFNICFKDNKFRIGRQEDSHEFMIYLLDNLHEALSCEIEYNINGDIMNDRDRIMKDSFKEWIKFIEEGVFGNIPAFLRSISQEYLFKRRQ